MWRKTQHELAGRLFGCLFYLLPDLCSCLFSCLTACCCVCMCCFFSCFFCVSVALFGLSDCVLCHAGRCSRRFQDLHGVCTVLFPLIESNWTLASATT